jgi:hypothetical protein
MVLLGDTASLERMVKGVNLHSSRTAGLVGLLAQLAQIVLKVTALMATAALPYPSCRRRGALLLCTVLVPKGCSFMERTAH